MPSAPSFKPAYIPVTSGNQEMVSPISHQSSNSKSNTSEIFISSWYAKQNNLLPSIDHLNQPTLRLRDVQPGYICCGYDGPCYPVRNEWMSEKIAQLWVRLGFVTYILVKRLLYQQGYILVRGEYWLDIISEYKAYESKSSGLLKPICDSPLKYIYRNNRQDITVNFSDLNDNCEFVH
ncbi:hypothetical protein GLOIN_2v1834454 [Rhizophagus clarus]|uniref:Uncharacterized protein n=1 Tax=Rhizophagus clarus TaxID=94130 RepID=A0A8H3MBY2_9GLOM|nr:hypothetical protein GLOIN_2v1834454 [Rhizophagus clarus]